MAHVGEEQRLGLVRGIGLLARSDQVDGLLLHQALQMVPVAAEFQFALDVVGDVAARAAVANELLVGIEQRLAVDLVPARALRQADGIAQNEALTRLQAFTVGLPVLLFQLHGQLPYRLAQRPVAQRGVVSEHGVDGVASVRARLPEAV